MSRKIKEIIYNFTSKLGINVFQKIFPDYFGKEPLKPTDRYIEYPFIIKNLPKPSVRILDVGCAGSFFPLILAGLGYDTYGLDIREYAIINKINFDNFHFIKEDIRETSFPDIFFDVIIAISTLEHIGLSGRYGVQEDLSGDKKAVDEMIRILKPAGNILLTLPFGRAKIIEPYSKIYDDNLIRQLTKDLLVEKEEYFMQDSSGNWYQCFKHQAEVIDATSNRYPLCLLKLVKV